MSTTTTTTVTATNTMESTPIVLIGQTARVAKFMVAKLLPEYEVPEVIKFISDIERAKEEVTTIMTGGEPSRDIDNLGSHNFSRLPKHIVFGKGYQIEYLEAVREAVGGVDSGTSWYWAPLAEGEKPPPVDSLTDEQISFATDRISANVKRVLSSVQQAGKEGMDGIYEL